MSNEQNYPFYQRPSNFALTPPQFISMRHNFGYPRSSPFSQPQQQRYQSKADLVDFELVCKQREDLFKMVSCFFHKEDQIGAPLWPSDLKKNAEREKHIREGFNINEDLFTVCIFV